MGRKMMGKFIMLGILLAALYGQQESCAGEIVGAEHREFSEKPMQEYQLEYKQPDGREGYYVTKPEVRVTHREPKGRTLIRFTAGDGTVVEKMIVEEGEEVISEDLFTEGRNVLEIWMEEISQEETKQEKQYVQKIEFPIDTSLPLLQVQAPSGFDTWYQYGVILHIKASEQLDGSGINHIACYINGEQYTEEEGTELLVHVQQPSVGGRGMPVRVVTEDRAGNQTVWERGIYIDAQPPVLQIQGADDYTITGQDVDVVYEAGDENLLKDMEVWTIWTSPDGTTQQLEEGIWTQRDGKRQFCQKLIQEGTYQLKVRGTDQAGFSAVKETQVIIDKNNPVISYIEELNGTYLKEFCLERPVSEIIGDFTSYTYGMTLDGTAYTVGQLVKEEGQHWLKVTATDAAGHCSEAEAGFVIDHTPPEISFGSVENGKAYEEEKDCQIFLDNRQDRITSVRVNGKEQMLAPDCRSYRCKAKEYQMYDIHVEAEDLAGNVSKEKILFQVVPRKTIAEQALGAVKETLGIESKSLPKADEHKDRTERGRLWRILGAGTGIAIIFLAGVGNFVRKRRKKK